MSDETITLPCGSTLRRNPTRVTGSTHYTAVGCRSMDLWVCRFGRWSATCDGDFLEQVDQPEAIAWLNARVLALRAALLSPGAVVVRLDAETREAVARRLWRLDASKPQHYAWTLDWPGLAPGSWAIGYGEQADAVLDALRERAR